MDLFDILAKPIRVVKDILDFEPDLQSPSVAVELMAVRHQLAEVQAKLAETRRIAREKDVVIAKLQKATCATEQTPLAGSASAWPPEKPTSATPVRPAEPAETIGRMRAVKPPTDPREEPAGRPISRDPISDQDTVACKPRTNEDEPRRAEKGQQRSATRITEQAADEPKKLSRAVKGSRTTKTKPPRTSRSTTKTPSKAKATAGATRPAPVRAKTTKQKAKSAVAGADSKKTPSKSKASSDAKRAQRRRKT